MKNYTIHEFNEKRGHIANETFKSRKEAIARLAVIKFVSERHGRVVNDKPMSFTWYWEDANYTAYKSEYKIIAD